MTVADVFDALSTNRSYKSAFDSFHALKIMKEEMPQHFNPRFLQEFILLMGENRR